MKNKITRRRPAKRDYGEVKRKKIKEHAEVNGFTEAEIGQELITTYYNMG